MQYFLRTAAVPIYARGDTVAEKRPGAYGIDTSRPSSGGPTTSRGPGGVNRTRRRGETAAPDRRGGPGPGGGGLRDGVPA